MSYPKELWENTRIDQKTYPFQLFRNRSGNVKPNDCILYLHWHEHFEIIVMRQGSAMFHIDSRPYIANEGDMLFIPGGGLHVGYSLRYEEVVLDCLVFNASLFNDWVHDPIHAQYVAPYLEGRLHFPVKPADHDDRFTEYFPMLQQAIDELIAQRPAYQLVAKSQLHGFFTLLSRHFLPQQAAGKTAEPYSPNRDRFKQLIRIIETSFDSKLTVEQAAAHVNLNPYHFCKSFKKLTGRTYIEYVNVCRMNEAERLLRDSDLTVTEIAGRVGCDNPNYFTKLYKQYKGATPSSYRNRI